MACLPCFPCTSAILIFSYPADQLFFQLADTSGDASFDLQPHEDSNITTVSGLISRMSWNLAKWSKGGLGVAFAYSCFFVATVSSY
jgi:hypothetical protein